MADWTKATTARRALENIGVLAAGQSPSNEDQDRAEEIVQSVYEQLDKRFEGLPFLVSAIPEPYQTMFRDIISKHMVGPWQIRGQKRAEIIFDAVQANKDLYEQLAGRIPATSGEARYY